jgi:ABC-type uncharacterized transport system auxiliary subunit
MILFRLSVLALVPLALSGCLSGVLPDQRESAVYGLPEPLAVEPSGTPWPGVLRIEPARATAPIDSATLIVRRTDGELQSLAGARWAAPLPGMFSELLARQANQARLAHAVTSEPGVIASRLLLSTTIDHFELIESDRGLGPHAEVRARLVCVRTQSVLASSEPIRVEARPEQAGTPTREAAQALRASAAVAARLVVLWARGVDVSACPE